MTELGILFEENLTQFAGGMNVDEFKNFAPNAIVPCLQDEERAVFDSLAICKYIAEHDERGWPREVNTRTWARCVACELHSSFSALRNVCGMNVGVRVQPFKKPVELMADVNRLDNV